MRRRHIAARGRAVMEIGHGRNAAWSRPPDPDAEDAPTTGHKSARSARVEVITRGERRRVWTPEQKREIVMESLGPELTPTEVARKYAISSGLLYTLAAAVPWRADDASCRQSTPGFAQVEMTPSHPTGGTRANAGATDCAARTRGASARRA